MTRLTRWLRFGGVRQLRLFGIVLAVGSAAFLLDLFVHLDLLYKETGSWGLLWQREWRNGHALTDLVGDRLFQFVVIAVGWSSFLRLRMSELAHLRLRRSEVNSSKPLRASLT